MRHNMAKLLQGFDHLADLLKVRYMHRRQPAITVVVLSVCHCRV